MQKKSMPRVSNVAVKALDVMDLDLDEPPQKPKHTPPPGLPRITDFDRRVLKFYLQHGNGAQAYREAGGTAKEVANQSFIVSRILQHPEIAALVAEHRAQIAKETNYGAIEAMNEAKEAMEFARQTRNANALVKAIELRAKLQGLVIEKHDVRQLGSFSISIRGVDDEPLQQAIAALPGIREETKAIDVTQALPTFVDVESIEL